MAQILNLDALIKHYQVIFPEKTGHSLKHIISIVAHPLLLHRAVMRGKELVGGIEK